MTEMRILLTRTNWGSDSCLGTLSVDGEFQCYTLEDEVREVKVPGETAIPPGTYLIVPRCEGGMHPRYLARYPDIHVGMAWLQDVPGFEWVYIHTGNTDDDTDGCILVGSDYVKVDADGNHNVTNSRDAYVALYEKISAAWFDGISVWITVTD